MHPRPYESVLELIGRTPILHLRSLDAPGRGSVFVKLEDTIKGFKKIVAGECDDMPEASFYMVGTIEEAMEKARKMAAEAA